MATSYVFNGRAVKLPGAYSTVKSISSTSMISTSYGKVLIVNTNPDISFGGSVNGEVTKGKRALYRFRSLNEAQSFFRSGHLWNLMEGLFRPSLNEGVYGASDLYFINALTTTAPTITPTLASGKLVIKVKDEGSYSNGVAESGNLISGYSMSITSGVKNPSLYIFSFFRGTFKGMAPDGYSWDGVSKKDSMPELVCQSIEVASIDEFVAWATGNELFNDGFSIDSHETGALTTADKTGNTQVLALGGTATRASTDLGTTLNLVQDLDFNILLSLNEETKTGSDVINGKFQYFVQSETKYPKYLVVPGKSDGTANDVAGNIEAAKAYNSQRVWLVHGIPHVRASFTSLGYRVLDTTYMAALIAGRVAGLQPQIPVTFKNLNIVGLELPLTINEQEDCIDSGVLTCVWDGELDSFIVLRGINTLQNNTSLQNPDGSWFSIQITRICSQVNQDIVVNAKKQIFGDQSGVNASTVSEVSLVDWVRVFLTSKVATATQDNLILSFSDVNVQRKGDSYWVSYKFKTNSEISFIFFTGFAIN